MNEDSIIHELNEFEVFLRKNKIKSSRGLLNSIEVIRQYLVLYEVCLETLTKIHEVIIESKRLLSKENKISNTKKVEAMFKELQYGFWD